MSTSEKVCDFCLEKITRDTGGVFPGFGFDWYHPDCWNVVRKEMLEDSQYLDVRDQAEEVFEKHGI